MSPWVRLIAGLVLLGHGLGHGGAIGALLWIARRGESATGGWRAARSWLFPALPPQTAALVAGILWVLALIGFVAAALGFWGLVLAPEASRSLAVASAAVSVSGMVLFAGTWPAFNWTASFVVNVAVLITQLWLRWPPR